MICPDAVIQQDEKATVPKISDEHMEHCIACGQCVAICPEGAISHAEFPATTIQAIQFEQMPTTEQVLQLLKTRRSIRAFRDKPLAKDTIETIIDGARFAPSGYNSQSTEFLVVRDRAVLNKVSALVIEYLKFEIRRFANPLLRTLALLVDRELAESGLHEIPGFKRMIQMFESREQILGILQKERDLAGADMSGLDLSGKNVVVFCTYKLAIGSTLRQMAEALEEEGAIVVEQFKYRGSEPNSKFASFANSLT